MRLRGNIKLVAIQMTPEAQNFFDSSSCQTSQKLNILTEGCLNEIVLNWKKFGFQFDQRNDKCHLDLQCFT